MKTRVAQKATASGNSSTNPTASTVLHACRARKYANAVRFNRFNYVDDYEYKKSKLSVSRMYSSSNLVFSSFTV